MRLGDFEAFEPSPGFRVYVHPSPKFKTITFKLYVHEPLGDQATRVALLPFVLRRGCRRQVNMRKITEFLEGLYGASAGADVLKLAERQVVYFRFEVVNDRFAPRRIRALEEAIGFLWRMLAQPVTWKGQLHSGYVAQEKENLRRFIQGLINDRMSYAFERCVELMCAGEPYGRYEYGKLEEIDSVTPRELARVHERLVATAPVELYVLGDVQPARVAEVAARVFRFRRRKVAELPPAEIRAGTDGVREHVEKMEVEQAKLVLGCRTGIAWGHDDMFALVMYNGLLGAFPHSKLFVNVREKEGLAYATSSSLDSSKGLLFVSAGTDPAKHARCADVIRRQMQDLAEGKVTPDEWEKTRRMIADRVRSREDNPSGKIGAFAEMNLNGRPMTADELIAAVEKVAPEDVARVAARVRPDTLFVLTRP
jgi:predicted Zn-dependent peptidase